VPRGESAPTHARYPTEFLAKLQSLSMDMSAFTFLAGFLSSRAASAKPITVGERRRFYINRLGVMHTFFVFSAVFSLPAFFLRCGPGQCRQALGLQKIQC